MDTIQRSTDNHTKIQRWALIMSSMIVALPFTIATFLGWLLKSINPNNVDTSSGLAYLGQILITGWVAVVVVTVVALFLNIAATRNNASKTHWIIFGFQILLLIIFVLSNIGTESLK